MKRPFLTLKPKTPQDFALQSVTDNAPGVSPPLDALPIGMESNLLAFETAPRNL